MNSKPRLRVAILLILATALPAAFASADGSSTSTESAAQELLQLLQSPAPTPAPSTGPTSITSAPPSVTGPIGISLSTHILLNGNLIPENSIVPQAAPTTTAAATTTTTTASSTTALIRSLYAELQTLEAQIAALEQASVTSTSGSPQTASTTCTPLTLTQSLSLGSKGTEVSALQNFLQNEGYYTYPAITGYFGPVTEQAVETFQSAHNIVSSGTPATTGYGAVGPKTKAEIAALTSACESVVTTATPISSTTMATSSTATTTPGVIAPIIGGFGGGGGGGGSGGGGGGGPSPDTTPPTVSLTAPSSAATVSGSSVTLTAIASDNVSVANVQFKVDGTNIGAAITSSPYTIAWSSTGVSDGSHTLYAVAEDTSGNYATSSESVTVENTPVSISSISSGTPTTTSATITWTTNQAASSTVLYGTTIAYGSASSSTSFVTSHSIALTGLTASTTYHYQVQATNAAGNYATSSDQTFTTASGVTDTTPPTEPTNLSATPVSSSQITLSWTASTDNVGVTGYKIYRDGTQVATDTSGTTYNDTGLANASLHSYWVSAYDAAGNVSTSTNGISAQTEYGADQYGATWKPLRIGAGGFVTGIGIASDGTMVVRTDSYGAYIGDGTQWDQLVSTSSMPTSLVNTQLDSTGVYEIAIAPSESNIIYMDFLGYVFASTNRGVTWKQTNFAQVTEDTSDNYRADGQKMAVDPYNPNKVYVGTPQNGLFVTSNGGMNWQSVSGVPMSATDTDGVYPGIDGMAFDPALGVAGGNTNTIFAASYGNGVYESTNGGTTWSSIGGPTYVTNAAVSSTGVYYVAANGNQIWSYQSGTWTELYSNSTYNIAAVAVNPSDSNEIVILAPGGGVNISFNGGMTWDQFVSGQLVSNDIPWLAGTGYMTIGGAAFDPLVPNKLWVSDGVGVWYTTGLPTSGAINAFDWDDQSTGIEELVTNTVIAPPGGSPVVGVWDRGDFYIANPNVFPSAYGTVNGQFIAGWAVDYASNDPNYIAALTDWGATYDSGYSTNGGQTWTTFASFPSVQEGGGIAAASSTDIVIFPSNNSNPYYTLNGGATWTQISITGVPTSGETGWGFAYYLDRDIVAADRVNIGTFYAYNYGPSGDSSAAGVYRSTDGGVTWTQVNSGFFADSGYNAELRAAPGIAGELFFTGGPQSGDSLNSPANEPFMESTNGGSTWTAVPNVEEVYDFGFGKAAPGTTTPAIYIAGFVNNHYGIYESDDNANTWTQVGLWPLGSLDLIRTISGDMNAYGRVYVGFGADGYAYGETANAAPFISDISSGTPTTTSATITWTTDQSSNSKIVYGTTTSYGLSSSNASLVTSHSMTLTGLTAGTAYHYEVVSADTSGYTSTSTDQTFTTGVIAPSMPPGLTATATSSSEIDLSWNASTAGTDPVAGYQIFRDDAQVGTTTSGTTYADTGLLAGSGYTYKVDAYDTEGNTSALSAPASATTTGSSALLTSIAAYYKFDEGTGSTTADATGNGYTGTLQGGTGWTTGIVNDGLEFSGTNSDVEDIGAFPSLFANGNVTINAWVDPANTTSRMDIFDKANASNYAGEEWYWTLSGGNMGLEISNGTSAQDFWSTEAYSANSWQMVTVTYVSSTGAINFYINGANAGSGTYTGGAPNSASGVYATIGSMADGYYFFNGKLDEVAVWTRTLSSSEVSELYHSGAGLQYPF